MSCSGSGAACWGSFIHAATAANEQLDHLGRECKQAHVILAKLLRASQMRNARLQADQRILRQMLNTLKADRGRSSASVLPPDLYAAWYRQSASHSREVAEDEIEIAMHELKAVTSSLVAASGCHETWRRLFAVVAKMPSPKPEILSGPVPEQLPWPKLQSSELDSMSAAVLTSQPQTASRGCFVPSPEEFKFNAMPAPVPKASDTLESFRTDVKVDYPCASRPSMQQL